MFGSTLVLASAASPRFVLDTVLVVSEERQQFTHTDAAIVEQPEVQDADVVEDPDRGLESNAPSGRSAALIASAVGSAALD